MRKRLRFEHKITLAYLIIGGLWILFSDKLILFFIDDAFTLSRIQTLKGWFYVSVTAILFYFILRWYIVRLRKTQARAEESDRLKIAFLQNISHEIRTPMNSICGFSILLNKEGLSAAKRKQYTDIIINNSNQLLSIVNDILSIANIEVGQENINYEEVSTNGILKDIYDLFQPIAEGKNIRFKINNGASENIKITSDGEKIKQILWNLVSNAIKFTHKGEVAVGVEANNGFLRFTVEDTGIGIAPDVQLKVFNRFVQADPSIQMKYGGTGLGLTIAKAYVELLGGSIQLESTPNVGTKIDVRLPLILSIKVSKDTIQKPQNIDDKFIDDQTIVVAEDEEFTFLFIKEIIKETNTKIIRAKNGQEAVDICTNNPKINLVIMDIRMPIMNGIEATGLIKKIRPNLPIIANTAYDDPQHAWKTKKSLFDEYIQKPISEKKLLDLLLKYR